MIGNRNCMVRHIEKTKPGEHNFPVFALFEIRRNISIHAEFSTFMIFCNFILI